MWWLPVFLLTTIPLSPVWPGDPFSISVEAEWAFADETPIEPDFWGTLEDEEEADADAADHENDTDSQAAEDEEDVAVPTFALLKGEACIRDLVKRGLDVKAAPAVYGVETPVHLKGDVGGVLWVNAWDPKVPMHIDCRFAYSLLRFAPILKAHHVQKVTWTSTYRAPGGRRITSQHGRGLAVDVHSVILDDGRELVVLSDWRKAYGTATDCVGTPPTPESRILRTLVCQTEDANIFRLVLTPDSDWGHQNHFHIDGFGRGQEMRRRYAGRLADQPLPGEPAFENWWKWYICYKKRTPKAREACWNNRAYLKPRKLDTRKAVSPSVAKPREPKRRPPSARRPRKTSR